MNAIASLINFLRPSTDRAIRGITKALDHLDAVVAHEEAKADKLDQKITKVAKARLDAIVARDRAAGIAKRFSDLVA